MNSKEKTAVKKEIARCPVSRIIASATRDCIVLFDKMPEEKGWAQDQLTRFNIWANNIGVFAHGHASFDYRLRDAPDILDIMMQQVGLLRANLDALSHPTEIDTELCEKENTTESRSVSVDMDTYPDSPSSDASSLISGSDLGSPDFDSSLVVEETITSLYRLSTAIRKSGSHYRDLRAEKYIEVEYLEDGTPINLTERFLEDFAMKVVPHRVPRRVNLVSGQHQTIAELWLQERLARTIAQRRNRFLYWRRHQENLENSSKVPQPVTKRLQPTSHAKSQAVLDRKPLSIPTIEFQEKSVGGTEDTRHTPIDKIAFPKLAASKKSSNTSTVSFIWKNVDEIPGAPQISSTETHFTCPLCFILCEAKESQGKYWTQHIFRDLKPYICLFEDCQSPNALFGSFREWIEHMLEDRKASEWLCASAAHTTVRVFSTEEDFKEHLMTERGHTLSELQLSKIARRSMRPAFRIFDDCPLCDFVQSPSDISEREAQDILQRHIAEHLQALSLLSLPNRVDDGFTYESSEESSGVAGERSSLNLDADALSFNSDPSISGEATSVEQQESLSEEEQIGERPDIGTAVSDQEKYAEAEKICRETLVLNLKDLGKEHPTTLRAMENLGQALSSQRKYVEAEEILREALSLIRKVIGPDNSETLVVMKTLGQALSSQEKHAELEELYREVLFMVENAYGEGHLETLTALSNLGQTLSDLGKYAEAAGVFERALVVKKKMLGTENSSTLDTANRLVFLYWNQGQVDEAEAVYPRVLAGHLASKADVLVIRDEDYFDVACQQLCHHLQQWVLRFSKYSDMRTCRFTSEINNDKTIDRLDNAILDGSDVDDYLADRVKRRDVFMSITITMLWEYVFTRYLFGMNREQRQKLKSLEKMLVEVGPKAAAHQWRARTLTLLAKTQAATQQREQDTRAVVHAILGTLSEILPPPSHLAAQVEKSLTSVIKAAVELSIEMRCQPVEYMMTPPLQPEYDVNGDLAKVVSFSAALMNERSGETASDEDLEAQEAIVQIVLFPLVVKTAGGDEFVIYPAQVLIAKSKKAKLTDTAHSNYS